MWFFSRQRAGTPVRPMIEAMEMRQLLSGSVLDDHGQHGRHGADDIAIHQARHSGLDDGAGHDANDDNPSGGTAAATTHQHRRGRGKAARTQRRRGADDVAGHNANDQRRGRGQDDGANHNQNEVERHHGADDATRA